MGQAPLLLILIQLLKRKKPNSCGLSAWFPGRQHCEKRSVALVDGKCSGLRIELLCLLINFLQPLPFLLFKIFPTHSSFAIKLLQLQSDIFTQPTMSGLLPGQTNCQIWLNGAAQASYRQVIFLTPCTLFIFIKVEILVLAPHILKSQHPRIHAHWKCVDDARTHHLVILSPPIGMKTVCCTMPKT